jgi:hypothetical protein
MAKFAEMTVCVNAVSEKAALCVFHEDTADEQELWVPISLIQNVDTLYDPVAPDSAGNVVLRIEKWFLKENSVEYDHEPQDTYDQYIQEDIDENYRG